MKTYRRSRGITPFLTSALGPDEQMEVAGKPHAPLAVTLWKLGLLQYPLSMRPGESQSRLGHLEKKEIPCP